MFQYAKVDIFYYSACTDNCQSCDSNGADQCDSGQCKSGYYLKNEGNTCESEFIIYLSSHYLKMILHCLPKCHSDSSVVIALQCKFRDPSLNQTHNCVCENFPREQFLISLSIYIYRERERERERDLY